MAASQKLVAIRRTALHAATPGSPPPSRLRSLAENKKFPVAKQKKPGTDSGPLSFFCRYQYLSSVSFLSESFFATLRTSPSSCGLKKYPIAIPITAPKIIPNIYTSWDLDLRSPVVVRFDLSLRALSGNVNPYRLRRFDPIPRRNCHRKNRVLENCLDIASVELVLGNVVPLFLDGPELEAPLEIVDLVVLRATGLNFGREHEVVSPKFKLEVLFAETCQRELENHALVSRHVDVCRRVGVARVIVALIRPPDGTAGPGTAPLPGPFAAPGTPAT